MANYTYDTLNRLTEAVNPLPSNPLESFTYDEVGNRINSNQNGTSTFNSANQLEGDANFTYSYDNNGNLTQKTDKTTSAFTLYEYDAENKLIRVVREDSSIVNYKYDGLGRRIEKEVDSDVTQYIYDQEDILLELDGSNNIVARYTHGPGVDEPLIMERSGVSSFYHADGLGSITELTDTAGTVVQSYTYSSFGKIESQLDLSFVQPYTFTSREFDPETGLNFYRARYYDPGSGRFLSEDLVNIGAIQAFLQLAKRDVTLPTQLAAVLQEFLSTPNKSNLFVYVRNNPVNSIDPLGLIEDSVRAAIRQAAAKGDVAELETIFQATGNQAAKAAIDRLRTKAADIIARECKGSINRVFPSELREKTLEQIINLARRGDKAGRTARKLLSDLRFKK